MATMFAGAGLILWWACVTGVAVATHDKGARNTSNGRIVFWVCFSAVVMSVIFTLGRASA